ncbi:aminoglycoside phosphotransferase family protein [Umezawaea sp.]|uniref:aminoglycoside phosphotransferase family protein n=1 Tax=Umezawaea sp. TaxID=1955258 RepID=UPI002ED35315
MDEELLTGGGLNEVVRVGGTVRRPTGPWTPRVHELLRRLAPVGFVPEVHGVDPAGREVLSYLPGEVGHPPLPEALRGDATLVAYARMVRRLHDASVDLVGTSGWQFPPREPAEVVCHGDLAPYNVVFSSGEPVGVIDWDTAHPAPRWWDVAYAVYCLAPFSPEWGTPASRWRRAELFCAEYGCPSDGLAEQVLERLAHMVRTIREDPAFHVQRVERHDEHYLSHAEHVRAGLAALAYR